MIVAGFGFRSSANVDSLRDAYEQACAGHPAHGKVRSIATVADKAESQVFQQLSTLLGLYVTPVPPKSLEAQNTSTQSQAALKARSVGSMAEAAALAGAGECAVLLGPRVISNDSQATCALAWKDDR